MSDEKALLGAIWEHPHEDTPRLAYADWLQETGEPANVARAEFIRLQCKVVPPELSDSKKRRAREEALRKKYGSIWKKGLPQVLRNTPYARGFLQPMRRKFTGAKFLALPAGALDAAPVWEVELTLFEKVFDRILASPNFERIGCLYLRGRCTGSHLDALAAAPSARHIRKLTTFKSGKAEWLTTIRNAPGLASMQDYDFYGCMTGPEMTAFSESAFAPTVTRLNLSNSTQLGTDGATALTREDRFTRLRSIELAYCQLKAAQLEVLLNSPFLFRISLLLSFHLGGNPIGDAGLEVLLSSKWAQGRTSLHLSHTDLTDAGAELLAKWPRLSKLTGELALDYNKIGAAGGIALAQAPLPTNLENLNLIGNPLCNSEEAIAALRERFAGTKTRVALSRTPVTTASIKTKKWAHLV
jgi:uncharacterized protein (TIGR02996 family)